MLCAKKAVEYLSVTEWAPEFRVFYYSIAAPGSSLLSHGESPSIPVSQQCHQMHNQQHFVAVKEGLKQAANSHLSPWVLGT